MEKIHIGTVLKPQGIAGQIKISDYTDGPSALKNLTQVFIGEEEFKVLDLTVRDGAIFMMLKGIADRNGAELLRGKDVCALREQIVKKEGTYFIVDIIGCDLYLSSGKLLGKITDVKTSNVDIFTADTTEGVCYFPFIKKLNAVCDVENKRVTVDAKVFTEVVLYEGK